MNPLDRTNEASFIDSVDWFVDDALVAGAGEARNAPLRTRCKTRSLRDLISPILDAIEQGEKPRVWTPADKPWGSLVFSPRSLLTIGGPANGGKTALVVDVIGKLLSRYGDLRIVFASNDMDPEKVGERFLANVAGWNYSEIRDRLVEGGDTGTTKAVRSAFEIFGDRLTVVLRPFTMAGLVDTAQDTGADIVVLDTLQATDLGGNNHDSQQKHVAAVMRSLRALADMGPCVVATSPLSRNGVAATRDRIGKTDVNPLDMGYFAHAHEIEAESDVLLLLLTEKGEQLSPGPDARQQPVKMWLQCVKSRDSVKAIVPLWFDGSIQQFRLRDASTDDERAGERKQAAGKTGIAAKESISGNSGTRKATKQNGTRWLD
jgi:hypothetical protein